MKKKASTMVRTNCNQSVAERAALKKAAKPLRICPAALLRQILDSHFKLGGSARVANGL